MSVQFFSPNEKVKLIDELGICGCGNPKMVYRLIHVVMKEILESSVKVTDYVGYYDYMIYQLNEQGFLEHGSSIYGSWIDGRWYEWEDIHGNREIARMKLDVIDHFYPQTKIIKEEDVCRYREIEE